MCVVARGGGVSTVGSARRSRPVVANWKMHGRRDLLRTWAYELEQRLAVEAMDGEVVVCPPFPYLLLFESFPHLRLGAQDVSAEEDGAHTGSVSAAMLRDCDCRYVIVGHSERRCEQQEGDALVALKVLKALAAGLRPIVCLGESRQERAAGLTETVLLRSLDAVLEALSHTALSGEGLHLAYEPLWAIGSGRAASAEEVARVHSLLRRRLSEYDARMGERTPILYGGSVRAPEALRFRALEDVDGLLVGGASQDVAEFHAICRTWHELGPVHGLGVSPTCSSPS